MLVITKKGEMVIIQRREIGKTTPPTIIIMDIYEKAVEQLLEYFKTNNIKQGPNKTDAGTFYELIDDKYIETKNTVIEIPDGYILSGSRTIESNKVAEYEIIVMTPSIIKNYINNVIQVMSTGLKPNKYKCKVELNNRPLSISPLTSDYKYTEKELKEMPIGTFLISPDKDGNFYHSKIIKAYDQTTNSIRVHFNDWANIFNETIDISKKNFYKTNVKYDESPLKEYDPFNEYDLSHMAKLGQTITDHNTIKLFDIVEVPIKIWGNFYWIRRMVTGIVQKNEQPHFVFPVFNIVVHEYGIVAPYTAPVPVKICAKVGTFTDDA